MMEGRLDDARDINSRFYFDTGAGFVCFSLRNSRLTVRYSVPRRSGRCGPRVRGWVGRRRCNLTTLKNFSIGPFRFRQIPTYVFDDSYDVTNYPQLGGLIGNDLLRRFNLILNYARSEIYLMPNAIVQSAVRLQL